MKNSYFKYILALLLFGSNGIVASHISLTSYEIVLLRTFIGSILLIALSLLTRVRFTFWLHKRQFLFLAISGMATGASWMFLYEAYQQTGVSIASLAYYCGPVIVMALSPFLFHERLTPLKAISFLVVLCGIFLVNAHVFQEGKTRWGLFCGGMSAVMYAFMVIFNKKAESIIGLENSTLQLSISFLTVAAFVGLKQGFLFTATSVDWAPILTLGLLNTGIGCYLYFSSIGHLPAQTVAICGYIEPLSAIIFSVLLLQETMQHIQIIGAVLIIGGAVFGECVEPKTVSQTYPQSDK
jgi:drug/metabolite transporter (DMT)-like permease